MGNPEALVIDRGVGHMVLESLYNALGRMGEQRLCFLMFHPMILHASTCL